MPLHQHSHLAVPIFVLFVAHPTGGVHEECALLGDRTSPSRTVENWVCNACFHFHFETLLLLALKEEYVLLWFIWIYVICTKMLKCSNAQVLKCSNAQLLHVNVLLLSHLSYLLFVCPFVFVCADISTAT